MLFSRQNFLCRIFTINNREDERHNTSKEDKFGKVFLYHGKLLRKNSENETTSKSCNNKLLKKYS